MLATALGESKLQLLQKMAGTVDRPACKQLEVCLMRKTWKVTELSKQAFLFFSS